MMAAAGFRISHGPLGIDVENRPVIVAGIAGMLEQAIPHVGLAEGFCRQHPVEECVAFLIVAIGVDLDIAAPRRDTLDLAYRLDAGLVSEIVHHIDAKRRRDAVAGKRQLLRAAAQDAAACVGVAVVDRILRDFEPPDLEARDDRHQVAHEEALGTTDVQHAVARLEPEMRGDVSGNGYPAPIIAVAAITLLARTVEIFATELPGEDPVLRLPLFARDQVALRARIFREQIDLRHRPRPSSWRASRPTPHRAV